MSVHAFDPSKHERSADGRFAAKAYAPAPEIDLGVLALNDRLEGAGLAHSVRDVSHTGRSAFVPGDDDEHALYEGYVLTRTSLSHFDDGVFSVSELPDGTGRVRVVLERESEYEWGEGPRTGIDRAQTTVEVVDTIANPRDEEAVKASLQRIAGTAEVGSESVRGAEGAAPGSDITLCVSHDLGYVSSHVESTDEMVYPGRYHAGWSHARRVRESGALYTGPDGSHVRALPNDSDLAPWTVADDGETVSFGEVDCYLVAMEDSSRGEVEAVSTEEFERTYRPAVDSSPASVA